MNSRSFKPLCSGRVVARERRKRRSSPLHRTDRLDRCWNLALHSTIIRATLHQRYRIDIHGSFGIASKQAARSQCSEKSKKAHAVFCCCFNRKSPVIRDASNRTGHRSDDHGAGNNLRLGLQRLNQLIRAFESLLFVLIAAHNSRHAERGRE